MSANPFFSIIIPAYNVDKYIERAVTSILNQVFKDIEIIIVNDGSTDNTTDIINNFLKNNSNISIINHSKNESLHMARMSGVINAKGKYILFLDGDDYYLKNSLCILYKYIINNPDFEIYEFGYIERPSGKKVYSFYFGNNRFLDFFNENNAPVSTMWNKVYISSLLKKSFSLMENMYLNNIEDIYESIIIAFCADNIYGINKSIINYSIGTGVSTTDKDYDKIINYLDSVKLLFIHLDNFIKRNNIKVYLDNIKYNLLNYTINTYINIRKCEDEKIKLFNILSTYFDINIITKYLYQLNKKNNSIINSPFNKFLKIFLFPLRIIKRFFRKVL